MDFPQRRKKIATYGKSSRNTNYKFFSDAASPEKPRAPKPSWTGNKGYGISSDKDVALSGAGSARSQPDSQSVFDMPSSDDEISKSSKAAATKRPVKKMPPAAESNERVLSEDSASEQLHKEVAAAEAKRSSRKRSPSLARHGEERAVKKTSIRGETLPTRRDPVVLIPASRQDPGRQHTLSKKSQEVVERPKKNAKIADVAKERPTQSTTNAREANPHKRDPRNPPASPAADESAGPSQKEPGKHSATARTAPTVMGIKVARLQNINDAASIPKAHSDVPAPSTASAPHATKVARPRRNETPATVDKPSLPKGKSAPTLLKRMLPSPETKPSSPTEPPLSSTSPEAPYEEVDMPIPAIPPTRTSKSPFGTVTPRQHKAWSNLLDDADTESPSAFNLNELKLTQSVKPRKTMLQRSSSDMTHAAGNRRRRLIDTLKQDTDSDSDDDDDNDENETMVDADEGPLFKPTKLGSIESPHDYSSKSSQRTQATTDFSQESASSQTSAPATSGPKLTYARTRSYLNESSLEDELMLGLPTLDSLGPSRRTQPQGDPDDLEEGGASIRNIHELRAAGTARRVVDDIENLLDDIEEKKANSLSRRRSALMELCTKLKDKSYISRMVDHGLDSRLFHFCGATTDPVLGFLVASAMELMALAEAPKTTVAAMYSAGCLRTLNGLLKLDSDIEKIAKERRNNMSKVARDMLAEFRSLLKEMIWPEDPPDVVSPRVVALKSLESVVRQLRKSGNSEDLLGFRAFTDVAALAKDPAEKLAAGSASASETALLGLTLSILEFGSLNATAWTNSSTDADASMNQLAGSVDAVLNSDTSGTDHLEVLVLRLTLNLTNNNPEVCNVFASPTLVQNLLRSIDSRCQALSTQLDEEEHMKTLDRLILSLGAMINLAEFSDRARVASMKDGDGLLNSLVRCFLEGMERAAQADSVEESQSSVAYGYLAVLLGNLCQTWAVREKVRVKLPQQRLDVLIHAVQEFISVHQKVDKEAFDSEEGREVWANYTARLQGVINRLQGRAT